MAISYAEAVSVLEAVAVRCRSRPGSFSEAVPLARAAGRITACEYVCPFATPRFDSSAMDGFAVVADATRGASIEHPVIFQVQACAAAGDLALQTRTTPGKDDWNPCVEIMTGARFPVTKHGEEEFDAIVKVEDVTRLDHQSKNGVVRCVKVTKPVAANTHKRFAGSDFSKGDIILYSNQIVRPHHIMAMASVGFTEIQVRKLIKVGVWSTGSELSPVLQNSDLGSKIMDANGPFLEAALRDLGVDIDFLGVLADDEATFQKVLQRHVCTRYYDILLTTGAVSRGKFDFIPSAVQSLGAKIEFHGVAMRPGHPVLFASIPTSSQEIAFFGLPGNPVATAACLKFIVTPYLNTLCGIRHEPAIKATMKAPQEACRISGDRKAESKTKQRTLGLDHFKHGRMIAVPNSSWEVEVSIDQSPAKLKPFASANCWCHIKSDGTSSESSKLVNCFPF